MPTVPWIRFYQNWPRHKKTKALRKALGTAEPILCLWLWAAENAPDGVLDGISTEDIEDASEWQGKRGKALAAMVSAGFIDVVANGEMRLHNWMKRTGAGILASKAIAKRNRERYGCAIWHANRRLALSRDGACVECRCDSNLGVHHRIPVREFHGDERAHDLSNLVTLCSKHHGEADARYRRTGEVYTKSVKDTK